MPINHDAIQLKHHSVVTTADNKSLCHFVNTVLLYQSKNNVYLIET